MFKADSHLELLPASILDINEVFELIDMLFMGTQLQSYTVIPTLFASDLGVLGHTWSQNDVIVSWLRLTATSNFLLTFILDMHKVFELINMLSLGI